MADKLIHLSCSLGLQFRGPQVGKGVGVLIGAMAEFERALIQERVRADIRNARAKGRQLGRLRVVVDVLRVATLRARGNSWSQIQAQLGVSKGTAQRAFAALPKNCLDRGFWVAPASQAKRG